MLSTSSRFTQTLDSGVAPAVVVSAAQSAATAPGTACVNRTRTAAFATTAGYPTVVGFGSGEWTAIERKAMPKVDLHPDRWPLHSTS